jgi:hypothetical protein
MKYPSTDNLTKKAIRQITILAREGIKQWEVGADGVASIQVEGLCFQGDPFDHYVGRNNKGDIVFTLYPLSPCEVVYFVNP